MTRRRRKRQESEMHVAVKPSQRAVEAVRAMAGRVVADRTRKASGANAKAPHDPVADVGPAIQHQRGRLEVVDAADPAAPARTIRRAKAVPGYTKLCNKGDITFVQWMACDAYAVITEMRDGAQWVNGERVGGCAPPSTRGHPTMTQVQASARLTRAHAALGNDASALLQLLVVHDLSFTEIARRRKEGDEVVKGMCIAAVRRLAEHWGMREDKRA